MDFRAIITFLSFDWFQRNQCGSSYSIDYGTWIENRDFKVLSFLVCLFLQFLRNTYGINVTSGKAKIIVCDS